MNAQKKHQSGIGLLESLVTLLLIALLASWSLPHYQQWLNETAARGARNDMRTLIAYARQTSVAMHRSLILCGSTNGSDCDGQWQHYTIVRTSQENNQANSTEEVLARLEPDTRITIKGPGADRLFHPQPTKNMVNATFRFCLPASGSADSPRALLLVVNAMGRTRDESLTSDAECS
ncbi:GspH/FimT family protein [Phytohalomonas tamaricis]|uniref:GspH/FimT family protein n=1 Tax=Phytohalomonas tamaricis TaxID=2081032 RepID=UPI000D0B5BA2|nr:GspH/FimT family protein [Phytohalomonas tamaricis]